MFEALVEASKICTALGKREGWRIRDRADVKRFQDDPDATQ